MNWDEIATKCNTTSGAASKRYSRMKQAFEEGVAPPGVSPKVTPSKTKPTPKSTPKKIAATSPDDANGDGEEEYAGATSTPTSKRKRASSKKKPQATAEEQKFKPNPEDDEDGLSDEEMERKRVKAIKCKATPKPKPKPEAIVNPSAVKTQGARTPTTEATTLVKSENDDDDAFHDAQEEQQDDQEHGYVDDATAARKSPTTSPFPCCRYAHSSPSLPRHSTASRMRWRALTLLACVSLNGDGNSNGREECAQCVCDAKEIANVLLHRCTWLAQDQRIELERMVETVKDTE